MSGNDDQKKQNQSEQDDAERFNEGKPNAHDPLDSKDERSIANRLANEEQKDYDQKDEDKETQLLKEDARLPALSHGNKPSRGAVIDQQLKEEEEAILAKKGSWGPGN